MAKPTKEEIRTAMRNQARDNMAPHDPELARRVTLRMGGTPEEAEESARWAEQQNEARGLGTWEEYEKAMTAGTPTHSLPPQRVTAKAS